MFKLKKNMFMSPAKVISICDCQESGTWTDRRTPTLLRRRHKRLQNVQLHVDCGPTSDGKLEKL